MPLIDHIDGHQVPDSDGANELITLNCLSTGLERLSHEVRSLEELMHQYERDKGKRVFHFGFDLDRPDLPAGAEELLPCYFHWFGMSVCNYARLVGFLAGIGARVFSRSATEDPKNFDIIRKYCDAYVESIAELSPIKTWRDKVFAHFAITAPRPTDNAALLDSSVMSPITYFNRRFRVGGIVQMTRGAEVEMPPWSVTESFERLAPRFWPANSQSAAR